MFFHIVVSGDNISRLSKTYNVKIDRIIKDNNLEEPYELMVGQCLIINNDNFVYIVKKGDTLLGLAKKYSINLNKLIKDNNLSLNSIITEGQKLYFNYNNSKKKKALINGYCYEGISNTTLLNDLPYLSTIIPFTYRVNNNGNLSNFNPLNIIKKASDNDVSPILCIANIKEKGGFSTEIVHNILNDKAIQNNLIKNIKIEINERKYKIINIDFEYIDPNDKDKYIDFISLLKVSFPNIKIIICLAPKTSSFQKGLLYEAHDYKRIGSIADYVILMTYEWGYTYGEPQPIAPINLVKKVVKYAKEEINPKKILLGIPNYGYDWTLPYKKGTAAKSISNQEAINIAIKNKVEIKHDTLSQTPYFTYKKDGIMHIIHFDDACSYDEKINLTIEEGLEGLSIWTLTTYNPQLNFLIEYYFSKLTLS